MSLFKKILVLFFLVFSVGLYSTSVLAIEFSGKPLAGVWKHETGFYYITYFGDSPYLVESVTGTARRLDSEDGITFTYGPSRSVGEPIKGSLVLKDQTLVSQHPEQVLKSAEKFELPQEDFVVRNEEKSTLHGTLIFPKNETPKGVILFLSGEGPNDRMSSLLTGLPLVLEGYVLAIFDQRGAGKSTGEDIKGLYYARSMEAADDAHAVIQKIESDPRFEHLPLGIAGWSQGGWLGAVLANRDPNLDFYINIAGNSSPGWQQWRHAMTTWLYRKEVSKEEIAKAKAYFDSFFDVMLGNQEWGGYQEALEKAKTEDWFPVLRLRYFAEWESTEEALDFFRKEYSRDPEEDFKNLKIPALGIFFEFDQSTPPNSPEIFLRAVLASQSKKVSVHVLPGLNHGSWGIYSGYAAPQGGIKFHSVALDHLLAAWLESLTGP